MSNMALNGKGRITKLPRGGAHIYISKEVFLDSAFPFLDFEDVDIIVDTKKNVLIVKKRSK